MLGEVWHIKLHAHTEPGVNLGSEYGWMSLHGHEEEDDDGGGGGRQSGLIQTK